MATLGLPEVVEQVCAETGYSRSIVNRTLHSFIQQVKNDLLYDNHVIAIKGFGRFEMMDRAARQGRDPRTGETVEIPASKRAKFFPAKAIKSPPPD